MLISLLSRDQIFAARMEMKGQKTKTFQIYFKVIIMQFAWRIVGAGWGGGKGIKWESSL